MRTPMNAMRRRRNALAVSLCAAVTPAVCLPQKGIPEAALALGAGSIALLASLAVLFRRLRHARLILDTPILTVPSAVISEPENGRTARLEETVASTFGVGIPAAFASSPAQETEVEGWHLIESLYMVPGVDLDVNGGPIESRMTGAANGRLLGYYQDSGMEGDVVLAHYRTDAGGTAFTSVRWEILWENPPAHLPGDQSASITVEHRVLEAKVWDPPGMTAAFDAPDMEIGYASSSPNILHKPGTRQNPYRDETAEVYGGKAVMTTERPIAAGEEGGRMALCIAFGAGYGMRCTYQWGIQAANAE